MPKNFTKDSLNKLDYSLVPAETLEDLVRVLNYGAKKYSADNWKQCKDVNIYINALIRHLQELRKGNFKDEESNLPHCDHLMANAMFISMLIKKLKYEKDNN